MQFKNTEVCLCDHKEGHAHAGEVSASRRLSDICSSKIQRYVFVITKKGTLMQERSLPQGDCLTSAVQKYRGMSL